MGEVAVEEARLGLVVDLEDPDLRTRQELVARQLRLRRVGVAGLVEVGVLEGVAERVAEVLAEAPGLVEGVLELVAREGLLALEGVDGRVADIERARDAQAAQVGPRGAEIGQEVRRDRGRVALVARQDGERGARVRTVGESRRDVGPVVRRAVDLGPALPPEARQAIEPVTGIVGGAADVEGAVDLSERAAADLDIAEGLGRGALRDLVDDAARIPRAEQHGRGAAQHLDPLQAEGLDLEGAEAVVQHLQTVAVDAVIARDEAAQGEVIDAGVGTEGAGIDAGGVLRRLGERLRLLRVDLLAADHGDRLRGLDQRGVGLGRGGGAGGDVARDRAARILRRRPSVGAALGRLAAAGGAGAPAAALDRQLFQPRARLLRRGAHGEREE
ncbi:hypothetical protein CHKEEEPN_1274 [Methylorubrum podarium]|nr:hypothetical protein CHKEEEPN_1274 [Methylorubrum podarium]